MTQPERGELLTTQGVAEELGVSSARIRQMISEGKLPPPTNLGARFHVWHRADIEFVRAQLAGEAPSTASGVLRPPLRELPRTVEEILEVPVRWSSFVVSVHVRVWHGPASEGMRTVVMLGELHDGASVYAYRAEVMAAVAPLLPVPVHDAVWFLYHPGTGLGHGAQQLDNLILTPHRSDMDTSAQVAGRVRHFFRRAEAQVSAPVVAQLRPVSIAEVERVVGAPVEAYPESTYTRRTIEEWTRTGRIVEVEHDVIGYRSLGSAARTLHSTIEATTNPARRETLTAAVHLLVDEIRNREAATDLQQWQDGTTPEYGQPDENWPTTWAARLVRPQVSAADQTLIDTYPTPFTIPPSPDEHGPLHELLSKLRGWAREMDRYADHPQEKLHRALQRPADLLAFYIGAYDRTFRERDHPASTPRLEAVAGRWDRAYLAALTPVHIEKDSDGGSDTDREHARSYRILREKLGDWVEDPALLGQGLDPDGRLVLHYPAPDTATSARRGERWFAVEWPLLPPTTPVPPGTRIVADPDLGDRPVYLVDPSGRMNLLPADPGARLHGEWNFGGNGEGVGALTDAITSAFSRADGIDRDRMPITWITDQLTYVGEKDDLNLVVDELRKRYR
ncbi:MAG: hypothetical protein JWO67_4247 [Streptosporangiaceae bacterium]|nr:hypothetical protein [Streptosporangiaceae bacterium]